MVRAADILLIPLRMVTMITTIRTAENSVVTTIVHTAGGRGGFIGDYFFYDFFFNFFHRFARLRNTHAKTSTASDPVINTIRGNQHRVYDANPWQQPTEPRIPLSQALDPNYY